MNKQKVCIFWFRRDLRLKDNHGLSKALESKSPVLPIFIFDDNILSELDRDDARVSFIYDQLRGINEELKSFSSSLKVLYGNPETIWSQLLDEYQIEAVYTNKDYEPYAIQRDKEIESLISQKGAKFHTFKDQVIFEQDDILKQDGTPYTVYTPYMKKWRSVFDTNKDLVKYSFKAEKLIKTEFEFPDIESIGFKRSKIQVMPYSISDLDNYKEERDIPSLDNTSYLSPHLRFGAISVRSVLRNVLDNETFVNELIWREFFMQILYHFPSVVHSNFRPKYNSIKWRNNELEFEKWKKGETGYPIVDAGMRQLNLTGYMHNRVRMITAGFLCKHLLIDWRWGEAYFAKKLLDYDLSANNGNWQWASGTGCDAAPYFRVFNPTEQVKKFDKDLKYIKKWVPELDSFDYSSPIVEHKMARKRALDVYKEGIEQNGY